MIDIEKLNDNIENIQEALTEIRMDWSDLRGWLNVANINLNELRERIQDLNNNGYVKVFGFPETKPPCGGNYLCFYDGCCPSTAYYWESQELFGIDTITRPNPNNDQPTHWAFIPRLEESK